MNFIIYATVLFVFFLQSFIFQWELFMKKSLFKFAMPVLFVLLLWNFPLPGLEEKAWHLFLIFLGTIAQIILNIFPMGTVALFSLMILTITKTIPLSEGLSGFSDKVVWLVLSAFLVAQGFLKTGLGQRIAYYFIYFFGKTPLGLSYGFVMADLVLAPAIPSNTARSGGVIYPILSSLCLNFDSHPHSPSSRKIGSFLMKVAFQANMITSTMFLTAMAANPLGVKIMQEMGIEIDWMKWFMSCFFPGMIALMILPLIIYILYPPELKDTSQAQEIAKKKIVEMGKMKRDEMIMSFVFFLLVTLWILSPTLEIHPCVTAFLGISVLLFTKVLDWKDISNNALAWDTFVWFGILVMLAGSLSHHGIIDYLAMNFQEFLGDLPWVYAYILLSLFYFYIHYLFASCTSHLSALFAGVLAIGKFFNVPLFLMGMTLSVFSNLFGCLTHYAATPASFFYGAGYIDIKSWWKIGFIVSIFHITFWMTVGSSWWKFLGYW